jgi:hypothetical protein
VKAFDGHLLSLELEWREREKGGTREIWIAGEEESE